MPKPKPNAPVYSPSFLSLVGFMGGCMRNHVRHVNVRQSEDGHRLRQRRVVDSTPHLHGRAVLHATGDWAASRQPGAAGCAPQRPQDPLAWTSPGCACRTPVRRQWRPRIPGALPPRTGSPSHATACVCGLPGALHPSAAAFGPACTTCTRRQPLTHHHHNNTTTHGHHMGRRRGGMGMRTHGTCPNQHFRG